MKILAWGAAVGAVAALVACGGGGGGNTGGSGGGGGMTTTTSSSTMTTVTSSSGSTMTTSSSSSSGGPACGGITWDDRADCQSCMVDSCCSEMEACGAGTPCDAWYQCAVACKGKGSACYDACDSSQAQGKADYDALSGCYDSNCKQQQACAYQVCTSGLLFTSDLQDCAECLGTNCCDQYTACMMDQGCGTCELSDPSKLPANCTDGSATATLYSAADTCQEQSCGKVCATSICGSPLGYPGFPSCNYCLSQQCCTEFDKCTADMNSTCYKCLTTPGATGCDTDADFKAFVMCRDVTCKTDCGG